MGTVIGVTLVVFTVAVWVDALKGRKGRDIGKVSRRNTPTKSEKIVR